MLLLKFAGCLSALFGLLFLFSPKLLAKLNETVNKVLLDLDSTLYKMRIVMGLLLCLMGAMMFYIGYYVEHTGVLK